MPSLLRRLQDSIQDPKEGTLRIRAGGFAVTLDPNNPLPWFNDAVPEKTPQPQDVAEMIDVFRSHGRRPRLEFFADLWPDVPALLEAQGFRLKDTQPALALKRDNWAGHETKVDARMARPEDADAINAVADVAFEGDGPDPNRANAIRESLAKDRSRAVIAVIDGEVVGCGRIVGRPDVREVVAIGTLPQFRRRGVGTAVTAKLLDDFFECGGEIAWLSAAPGAEGIYRRLGFTPVAQQVCYVLDEQK
jgi:ribosomal protein S18 acetylase RimI-like enzyme